MSLVLAHEIAHTMGMPEIYTIPYDGTDEWHEHFGTDVEIDKDTSAILDTNAMLCIMDTFANAATFDAPKFSDPKYDDPVFADPAGNLYDTIVKGSFDGLCQYCDDHFNFNIDTCFKKSEFEDNTEDDEENENIAEGDEEG